MANAKKTSDTAASGPSGLPSMEDLGKLLEQFKLPGIDTGALLEWQRKDMETLAEANRQAYEGIQALAQRRAEMLRNALVKWQSALGGLADKDAWAKQSQTVQEGIQQTIADFRELAQLEAETSSNAWKVVQDRLQQNMANLQKLLQPK